MSRWSSRTSRRTGKTSPIGSRKSRVLLPWAARQGPGILIGDLNAEPDADELGPVMDRYRDAWADAAAARGHSQPKPACRARPVFHDKPPGRA